MKNILIQILIDPEMKKKADQLKKKFGLKKNTELIRFLIVQSYRKEIETPKLSKNENPN